MTQTVEEATKALWDYINSLPPDQREKAVAYQTRLEAEAAQTEGGMLAVIPKRLAHNSMLLLETLSEFHEEVADVQAAEVLKKFR